MGDRQGKSAEPRGTDAALVVGLMDGAAGFTAGAIAGVPVCPLELIKVRVEEGRTTVFELLRRQPRLTWVKHFGRAIPHFAMMFGSVCALEFSVNERVRASYGASAGIAASGMTGAVFLAAADQRMLLRNSAMPVRVPWTRVSTGFTPMTAREACWIIGVMYLGPWAGAQLRQRGAFKGDEEWCNYAGRIAAGVPMAFVSHPFDVLTREMQIQLRRGETPSWAGAARSVVAGAPVTLPRLLHGFYRGVLPRMGLASFGGATAGAIYERVRPQLPGAPTAP